ncbi:DNA polymerase III subunit beta [Gorillibacterium sp. sgz500922]|uniref:DNA polymerase III subunit beta n=1 Tax=Gorillibacterium sp. sgz500922 TaxID=3446694 RepID=UPI003F669138
MLVEITKTALLNAVQHVIKAVAVNSPIPILQGIHIQAGEKGLSFTASNTSLTIHSMIPQDDVSVIVRRTGAIVIPSRYFYDVVRKLTDERLVLEIKEPLNLTIISGHSQIRLCGMDSSEFPNFDNGALSPNRLRIRNALFRSTIKQVAIMASTSETRPVLTGVFFECDNESVTLIATDGVRLASRTLPLESHTKLRCNAIIPAKSLYELSKMLSNEEESTEIEVSHNRVRFMANGLRVESVLIEGTFPSIKNVIPPSYLSEIVVDKARFLKAVECVTVLASENIIRLVASADKVKLLSRIAEIGDMEDEVPIVDSYGEGFILSLNGKLLIDILLNSDCASVRIRYAGKTSPMVILPDDSLMSVFLITPVRTPN